MILYENNNLSKKYRIRIYFYLNICISKPKKIFFIFLYQHSIFQYRSSYHIDYYKVIGFHSGGALIYPLLPNYTKIRLSWKLNQFPCSHKQMQYLILLLPIFDWSHQPSLQLELVINISILLFQTIHFWLIA